MAEAAGKVNAAAGVGAGGGHGGNSGAGGGFRPTRGDRHPVANDAFADKPPIRCGCAKVCLGLRQVVDSTTNNHLWVFLELVQKEVVLFQHTKKHFVAFSDFCLGRNR